MIRAIFFDYHGVLDKRTFRFGVPRVLADESFKADSGMPLEEYERRIAEAYSDLSVEYASGRLSQEAFWNELRKRGFSQEAINKTKEYIYGIEPDADLWNMLPELRKKYYLGILSDCSAEKYEIIKSKVPLKEQFDAWYFSCAYGIAKKDKEFFELMEAGGKFKKEEILFVDDQEKNVNFAKSLGYDAIYFRGSEEFRAELARREGI